MNGKEFYRVSVLRAGLVMPLVFGLVLVSAPLDSKADPVVRGVQGAIGGALLGGLLDGKKGLGKGALIGGTVGIIGGAIEEEKRHRYYGPYRRAYGPPVVHGRYPPPATQSGFIYDVQSSLVRLGYNPGPVDGLYGWRTSEAISYYQRDYGLPVTGHPTPFLLNHMHRNGG